MQKYHPCHQLFLLYFDICFKINIFAKFLETFFCKSLECAHSSLPAVKRCDKLKIKITVLVTENCWPPFFDKLIIISVDGRTATL